MESVRREGLFRDASLGRGEQSPPVVDEYIEMREKVLTEDAANAQVRRLDWPRDLVDGERL